MRSLLTMLAQALRHYAGGQRTAYSAGHELYVTLGWGQCGAHRTRHKCNLPPLPHCRQL